MKTKTTKRRRLWVNLYADGEHFAFDTKKAASNSGSWMPLPDERERRCVPFIERFPGDVVRTKAEEIALDAAIDRYTEAWEAAYATHTDEARRAVTECGRNLRALLRGGQ